MIVSSEAQIAHPLTIVAGKAGCWTTGVGVIGIEHPSDASKIPGPGAEPQTLRVFLKASSGSGERILDRLIKPGERVTSLKAHLKAASLAPEQGEAQWPGKGSFRRWADYLEHGIALPPQLAAELEALAREVSLTIAFAQAYLIVVTGAAAPAAGTRG